MPKVATHFIKLFQYQQSAKHWFEDYNLKISVPALKTDILNLLQNITSF